jgi:hypothetical protein
LGRLCDCAAVVTPTPCNCTSSRTQNASECNHANAIGH